MALQGNPAAMLAGAIAGKTGTGSGFTPPPASPARRRARRRNFYSALLFLSPWILGFLIFTFWPIIYSAYLSLTDYDVINAPTFTGFDNYVELAQDPKIALALGNTIFYTVIQVPLHIAVSLALALLLNRVGQASGFFRTVFFLPNMTPPVAVGVLFLLVFNGQNGFVNLVLSWLSPA
jgi:multiple sugar transport system permease protein